MRIAMTTMMSIGCVLNWAVPGRRLSVPSHDWTSFSFNSTQSLSFFFSSSSLKAWSNTRKWSGIAFVNNCVIRSLLLQPQVEWTRFYVSWKSLFVGFSMSLLPPGEKMWEYDDTVRAKWDGENMRRAERSGPRWGSSLIWALTACMENCRRCVS